MEEEGVAPEPDGSSTRGYLGTFAVDWKKDLVAFLMNSIRSVTENHVTSVHHTRQD